MKKIERPRFLSKMFTWIIAAFGFVFAIITFIISGLNIEICDKIIIVTIILLGLSIIYLIIFTIRMNKYCKNAEIRIIELEEIRKTIANENKDKTSVIFKLTRLITDMSETINDFVNIIETGLINIKGEEGKLLKKIHSIIIEKREKINEKKGQNNL